MLLLMVRRSLVPALTPLYLYVNTFRSMCAVPNMAVFCSSLTSWLPGMLLTYFLNDFEIVPVAPIITGIICIIIFFNAVVTYWSAHLTAHVPMIKAAKRRNKTKSTNTQTQNSSMIQKAIKNKYNN